MKKNLLVAFLVFFMLYGVQAQWYYITSPYNGNLLSIKFANANTGFIGANSDILKTTNGGTTWTLTNYSGAFMYNDFSFPSATVGYFAATNNMVGKTINQATSWTILNPNASPYTFLSLSFPTEAIGYAVGNAGVIRKTTDGGTTWASQTSGITGDINKVRFIDANTGVLCAASGKIRRTTNGGASWSTINSGTASDLLGMYFIDALKGFIVGATGTILKTSDGGLSWTIKTSGTGEWLSAVSFKNSMEGYVGGANGKMLKTTDGGETWQTVTLGIVVQWINDLTYVNNRFIGVADGGKIISDVQSSSIANFKQNRISVNIYPNPFLSDFKLEMNSDKIINNAEFIVYDGLGREIKRLSNISSREISVDFKGIKAGIYFYKIFEKAELLSTGKLIAN